MAKDNEFDFNTNWYELWMKQSKNFFETANENLKDMFEKSKYVNPEDHLKQINQWLEMLKNQWQFIQFTEEQKRYQSQWMEMCSDASDLMLKQWIKRAQEDNPVKNIRELYELWLNCCHEIYQKLLQSKAYQEPYGEFMNAAMKFWKLSMPK